MPKPTKPTRKPYTRTAPPKGGKIYNVRVRVNCDADYLTIAAMSPEQRAAKLLVADPASLAAAEKEQTK